MREEQLCLPQPRTEQMHMVQQRAATLDSVQLHGLPPGEHQQQQVVQRVDQPLHVRPHDEQLGVLLLHAEAARSSAVGMELHHALHQLTDQQRCVQMHDEQQCSVLQHVEQQRQGQLPLQAPVVADTATSAATTTSKPSSPTAMAVNPGPALSSTTSTAGIDMQGRVSFAAAVALEPATAASASVASTGATLPSAKVAPPSAASGPSAPGGVEVVNDRVGEGSTGVESHFGKRFSFEHFWLKLDGFLDAVKALWEGVGEGEVLPSNPLLQLTHKLRRTSCGLQGWSQRKVGSIRDLLLVANEIVLRLDVAQESKPLSTEEQWVRKSLKLKILGLVSLERTIARQRARVAGIKDGDATSQFFRILATGRRQRNCIASLRSSDRVTVGMDEKLGLATDHFLGLFGTAQPRGYDLSLEALALPPIDVSGLEAQFSEAEVWAAVRAMPANKSPGPDGFTWDFFRHCWSVVKGDVLAALHAIWLGRDQGFEVLNEALVTLVPKKDGAIELHDFRPISLVHSFDHLFTKVLARRLAPRMHELVGPNQTAFIRDRCIQDNFLLVKESAKLLHKRRIPSLLLKVDMAKAFDSISWPFILSVLHQRGFGPRHGRGLRQGDPISPLLFGIAMDVLSAMFRATELAGFLFDLNEIGLRHRVSLYANDVVVFAKPEAVELAAVWRVLGCFGAASGLLVNFQKSSAAPIQCPVDSLDEIAAALPCPLAQLPCKYLGLPLSIGKPCKADLQAVIDKLAAKLPHWKARLLSREGRLVYVQAVMSASVVYQLLALDLDPWFFKAVDKLQRSFLWVGSSEANGGCCAVAWHLVCQPKALGDLGLMNLRWMNVAMRARWIWLMRTDRSKPWSGMDLQVGSESLALFNASVRIVLGNGESILLWEDPWIGGLSVAAIAPELLKLVRPAVRKRRTVSAGLAGNSWALDIAVELSVDATVQYLRLWTAIQEAARGRQDEAVADTFLWKWSGDGSFSSRSAYRMLFQGTTGLPVAPLIWNSFAPLKHRFHAWLALRRRCWMANRRLRRGLATHVLCPFCDTGQETLDHLSLHCAFAQEFWAGLVVRLRLPNIVPSGNIGISGC
ncbi:hypothetical protein ACQ4PT_002002 [Festuca glaucescens]